VDNAPEVFAPNGVAGDPSHRKPISFGMSSAANAIPKGKTPNIADRRHQPSRRSNVHR
jgi:hypothetical protein